MDSDTRGLVTNLGWGVSLLVIVSLIFDLMRYFFPKNYYYREQANKLEQWNDYDGTPLYAPERPAWYPFAWLKNVLMYSEEDMVRTHGLDAAMYIRFLRMHGLLFAILALYNLIVLLPLYGTASNKSLAKTSDFFVTGVEIFSLSNVPAKDGRLWGTLISELVVLALVYLTVFRELAVYTKYRLEYRANSTRNPSNYAVIVLDIPPESRTPELIRRFFVRCFPGDVAFVHQIRDAENLFNAKSRIRSAMAAREGAQFKLLAAAAEDPDADLSKLEERLTDALQNQRVAEQGLDDMNDDLDKWAPVTHGAIIVFHSKRAATLACCTPLWNRSNEWVIDRAAEPRAVNWNRLEITNHTSMARSLITMGVLFAFCASWFFVIAGLQGLSNIKELSRTPAFKFLAPMANSQNPSTVATVQFVQGVLPPLLLFILLQLVPMLFRFVIGFERITSLGHFEAKIRSFLFLFYTMSNFVFVVTTGSILKDIQKIVDNPNQLFDFLATAVPAQATFLMKYVLISSFLGSAMGLLNIGRLLIRPLLMWKAKTTRQKRNATAIFSDFPLFKMYASSLPVSVFFSASFRFVLTVYLSFSPPSVLILPRY